MSKSIIQESFATGEEINVICERIEDTLAELGTSRPHALMALISLTLVLMNPGISEEDLQDGVKEVSRYICLLLEGAEEDPVAPELMN